MEQGLVKKTDLVAIGNAIREKNGTVNTYTPAEMATAIQEIKTGSDEDSKTLIDLISRKIRKFDNDKIIEVGPYAFCYCTNLDSVNLPNATTIRHTAFYGATSYWRNITFNLPKVTKIEDSSFAYSDLETISLPSLTFMGGACFKKCQYLQSVDFPILKELDSNSFSQCDKLTTVNCPLVEKINNYCFEFCGSLESVTFPAVKTIGIQAFKSCHKLKTLNLPVCENIGKYIFEFKSNAVPVDLTIGTNKVCTLASSFDGPINNIYVPANLVESYKTAANWSAYADKIKPIS